MKAAVLRNVKQPLSIEEISIDNPNINEVLVETKASGVCRTDLHYIEGNYSHQLPVVLGHEVSGIVKQVGDGVKYLKKGDTVVGCLSISVADVKGAWKVNPHCVYGIPFGTSLETLMKKRNYINKMKLSINFYVFLLLPK